MLKIRTEDGVAILTLSRPHVLNAIDQATVDAINRALDDIERMQVRALVITGEGRAFCAGADAQAVSDDKLKRQRDMYGLAERFAAFPKISVAAINGLALGGGLELALYCTLRVAGPDARCGFPEIQRSLMPGYGGTQLLSRQVGREHALRMLLTGDPIDAATALAIGLVGEIADDPVVAACALARRCSQAGFPAQQAVRKATEGGRHLPMAEALLLEAGLVAPLPAYPEAIAAQRHFVAAHGMGSHK